MSEFNKLQIRAKALEAVSELQYLQPASKCLVDKLINELKDISDKKTLAEILVNEMVKYDEPFCLTLCSLISKVIDNDTIISVVTTYLQQSKYNDTEKYRAVQLLRGISSNLSYENIIENFDNPAEILNSDTAKMLQKAIKNPEAKIDFMDFLSAISNNDKELLLNSFSEDFNQDCVANILIPILYSNFAEEIIYLAAGLLGDTKSSLAIEPLEYLSENSKNNSLIQIAKKGLAKLKLSGACKEKANEFILKTLSDSIPDKCYSTIPDGCSNQGILFTRLKSDNNYELSTYIINYRKGVIDSFGFFDVSQSEISRIVQRFFKSESQIIVSPQYVKTMLTKARDITKRNNKPFPYEFIAWFDRLMDISPLEYSIKEFVKNNIIPSVLDLNTSLDVLTKPMIKTWFFTASDNNAFNQLCNTCFTDPDITLEKIEKEMNNSFLAIWSEAEKKLWTDKIINTSYLLYINGLKKEAEDILGLISDENIFKNIQTSILKRSIHIHIFNLIEFEKEISETTNIFKKKQNETNKCISKEKLSVLDCAIRKKWIENE